MSKNLFLIWGRASGGILALALPILICISGIYAIPYLDVSSDLVVEAKRYFYLAVMIVMACSLFFGGYCNGERAFTYSCLGLFFVYLINVIGNRGSNYDLVYNIFCIIFLWLFVINIINKNFPIEKFKKILSCGVILIDLLAVLVVLLCVARIREIQSLVVSGFNGNRVNFSIWLSQFVFLNYFLVWRSPGSILPFAFSCSILLLQVFTGGRIGVLMTLALMLYFIPKTFSSLTGRVVAGVGLLILVWFAGVYSPTLVEPENTAIFRELGGLQSSPDLLSYVDRVSAHRVQITIAALRSIDFEVFLLGRGAGQFDFSVDNGFWMVHNVYLKMLGEFGFLAFCIQLLIVALPMLRGFNRFSGLWSLLLMWVVGLMAAALQPRFLLTGVGNCLVFWLCYALIFKATSVSSQLSEPSHRGELQLSKYI